MLPTSERDTKCNIAMQTPSLQFLSFPKSILQEVDERVAVQLEITRGHLRTVAVSAGAAGLVLILASCFMKLRSRQPPS